MFDLRYYQSELIDGAHKAWESNQSTAIISATGTGKCLAKGTPVLMWDGTIKPVEGVAIGDLLVGPDSRPRRVRSLARGREMMYRVTPKKGDSYTVNASHILSLKITPDGREDDGLLVNISVTEYMNRTNWFKHRAKGWRTGVEWPAAPVPLDPYFMGLWIGDGHHKRPQVTSADPEIVEYMGQFAASHGLRLHHEKTEGKCSGYAASGVKQRWKANPVTASLRDLGVYGNKHIPMCYLRNSREVRLQLLAGLIDSDGHLMRDGGYEFSTKIERIAEAVLFLARSLGFAAYMRVKENGCQTGAVGVYFRIHISGELDAVPVRVARKKHPVRKQKKNVLVHGIGVEAVGEGDYYGFTLDGDGLFLLGDYTVTHNTEMYMSLAVSEPGRVLVLVHRDYLINQPIDRLAAAGFEDVAVEKADERAETGFRKAKIVFASVQSIGPVSQEKRLKTFDPFAFSLVIVDEGHRGTSLTYRRVLDHFRTNPRVKVLILTATPKRKDGVALGNICDSVAGTYGPADAMHDGWIVPVKFYRRDVASLDFSNVRMKGTDLDPAQVQTLLMQEKPLHEVCSTLAEDRGPTIVFCPEVAIARAYEGLMNSRYRPNRSKMLYAESDDEERERAGKMLAQGELDYIFNVNLFTEGFDLPNLLRVVWAAPTASLVRYTQGVGRVFRTHPSLRGHLAGGRDTAAQRRLLIEQSPKPFGIVVTYYPVNCKHELCDPIDILGGDDLPENVKAFAKQIQDETSKQSGGSTTEEDITTATVFCDLRSVVDRRRKELKAKASYSDQQFDPMSGRKNYGERKEVESVRESAANVVSSWGNGDPMSEKQAKWFHWKRITPPEGMTKFQAVVVRDLIELGVSPQTALLYPKRQAMKVRDEMKGRVSA